MIDLHTHTFFSDGVLLPSELARRCEEKGFSGLAITDHVDISNIDFVIPRIAKVCDQLRSRVEMDVAPGAELTHIRPEDIPSLIETARGLGAKIVSVHGETIVEPVLSGTNRAAIEGQADILAHPGLVSEEDAALAAQRGVCLEISGRKGHSFTNGYVFKTGRKVGARLVFGSDSHEPGDLLTRRQAERVALGAGLSRDEVSDLFKCGRELLKQALK